MITQITDRERALAAENTKLERCLFQMQNAAKDLAAENQRLRDQCKPLTTEQYTAIAHRIASRYVHRSDPATVAYTFLPHTLEQFVRAIESKLKEKNA